jgi:hypothetical protein
MIRRTTICRAAAAAGLLASLTGLAAARAGVDTAGAAGGDSLPPTAVPTPQAGQPKTANFMSLMDAVGVGKSLDHAGIEIYGQVEGGYTYQFFQPNDSINGRNFDNLSNRPQLDQAAVNIERFIPVAENHFNIGGRVELMYGTDVSTVTASFQSYAVRPAVNSRGQVYPVIPADDYVINVGGNNSTYQGDVPDIYVDFGIPIGRGVRVRAGRFEFFKPLDPNERVFYSTTFVYSNVLPITNTGVTVAYDFTKDAGIEAGFSRGYNVTVSDDNGSIDFIGKGHLNMADGSVLGATTAVGPELDHDSRNYSMVYDLTFSHPLTKTLDLLMDGVYGHQFGHTAYVPGVSSGSNSYNPFSFVSGGGYNLPDSYYGVSGNLIWRVNRFVTLAGRAEWLRDEGGLLSSEPFAGTSRSLYEATIGATVKPFPGSALGKNIKIRPEVRYDYSNRAFFGTLPTLPGTDPVYTRKDQLTFGTDVIYNF